MAIKPSSLAALAQLGPGFRFHPTDEELVRYFLRRKVHGLPFRFDAISVIDIYKAEPWDLPAKSRLKTRDLEWYFFTVLDKKHRNGGRKNRTTERGCWKITGKDCPVYHKTQVVGMKKILVYHRGRAPRHEKTNWVMHEYKLVDEELKKDGRIQDAFVLCRVFQKSGSGPKNGEQYGAPFIEEEWEDEVLETVPVPEVAEGIVVSDAAYLDGIQFEQNNMNLKSVKNDYMSEPNRMTNYFGMGYLLEEPYFDSTGNQFDDGAYLEANDLVNPIEAHTGEQSINKQNLVDEDYLLDVPYVDATDNPQFQDGEFLEISDLANHIDTDTSGLKMLEEDLAFCDADDQNFDYMGSDSYKLMGSENSISGQTYLLPKASLMLDNIPAPPAFASEFPTNDSAFHLNSLSQSSGFAHLTAEINGVSSAETFTNMEFEKRKY